jgi:hypothetical protein
LHNISGHKQLSDAFLKHIRPIKMLKVEMGRQIGGLEKKGSTERGAY